MKRNIAFAVLAAMLLQLCTFAVYADDGDNSWSISYYGSFEQESERANYAANISDTASYDGSMALNVKCMAVSRDDANYIEIKNPLAGELQPGRYTLEFYVRKNSQSGGGEVHIGNTVINTEDMDKTAASAPNGSKNWKKYSASFDYDGGDNVFSFRFYSRIASYIIDNVSLTADGTGKNLIDDSGFEEYFEDPGELPDDPYDTNPYQPKSMRFTKRDTSASLNWKNPSTDTLSKIKVYDVTDGKNELLTDELSTESGKIIYYYADDLISGFCYTYKIVFSYTDKEDYIYYLGGNPAPKVSQKTFGRWTFFNNEGGKYQYVPSAGYVDSTVAHTGEAAFKLATNISLISDDNMNGNIYVQLKQNVAMEEGKTYRYSFWLKGENTSRPFNATLWFTNFDDGSGRNLPDTTGTYDWKHFEYDYTYGSDANHRQNILMMFYEGYAEGIWIDDVECYELDENDQPTGDNLISDGGFEELCKAEEASVKNLSAEADSSGINLSWRNAGADFGGVDIYQKVFDNYEYRGTLENGISSLKLTGLRTGKDYSFKVVPFNTDRVSGAEEEVSVTTLVPDYVIEKPVLTLGTKTVKEITGAGKYKLSVSAKNNALDENLEFEIIAVLYDKDDTRIKVYSALSSVKKRSERAPYTAKDILIDVPQDRGSYLEVYVVDSRADFNRVYDTVVYDNAE